MNQNELLEKKVIRSHIKNTYKPMLYIIYTIIIIFSLIFSLLNSEINKHQKNYSSIKKYNYSYVVESQIINDHDEIYYKLNNLVTITNIKNKVMHVNTYIDASPQSSTTNKILYSPNLAKDEVAISSKIATNLNLKLGDTLWLNLGIYEDSRPFKVKYILDYIDDLYNYQKNYNFSIIKLPYYEELIRGSQGAYNTFLNSEEFSEFIDSEYQYNNYVDVSSQLSKTKINLIIVYTVIILIYSFLLILFTLKVKKKIFSEVKKYFTDSYNIKFLKKLTLIDYIIYIVMPIFIVMILFFILVLFKIFNLWLYLILLSIYLVNSIILVNKRGVKFEKVIRV